MRSTRILTATLTVIFSLFVTAAVQATPYNNAVLADNPLAYWQLDDATTSIADASGNSHDGTADAGVLLSQPSLLPFGGGSAVNTIGNDRIFVDGFEKFPVGSTGYSVEYWINVNSTSATHNNVVGDGTGPFYLMNYLSNNPSPNVGSVRPHIITNVQCCSIDGTPGAIAVGDTYHVVSTWEQATGEMNIWITPATATNVSLDMTGIQSVGGIPSNTGLPLFIGKDNREPGGNFILDEVAIYNHPLSESQVQTHFSAASAVPEPSTLVLATLGMLGLIGWGRRRKRS